MVDQRFGDLLKATREASRWPEITDFAIQAQVSRGGYRKYESGERLPSVEMLEQIILNTQIPGKVADRLRELRDGERIDQVDLSLGQPPPPAQTVPTDAARLADRLHSEILYVLKQSGIRPDTRTKQVMKKRIAIILTATLED